MGTAPATDTQGTAQSSKHIGALDGIRGIAILLVLFVHLRNMGVLPQDSWICHRLSQVFSFGWSGVDLFFVLSGFLITGILLDTKAAGNRVRSFYGRRVLRIFPLYYLVVTVCLAAYVLRRNLPWVQQTWPTPQGWVAYLLYLQNWWMPLVEPSRMTLLGHLWSLGVEEQFYLIWPACVWLLPRKTLVTLCGGGCLTALAVRWFCMALYPDATGWMVYMSTITRMDSLLAGAFCSIAVRDAGLLRKVQRIVPFAAFTSIVGLLLIVAWAREIWVTGFYTIVFGYSLLAAGFGCCVLSAYLHSGTNTLVDRALRMPVLTLFGKYSYGIYVYQSLVQYPAVHFLQRYAWYGRSIGYGLLVSVCWLLVPFVVAYLSFHLFEKHFLRLKHRFKPHYGNQLAAKAATA